MPDRVIIGDFQIEPGPGGGGGGGAGGGGRGWRAAGERRARRFDGGDLEPGWRRMVGRRGRDGRDVDRGGCGRGRPARERRGPARTSLRGRGGLVIGRRGGRRRCGNGGLVAGLVDPRVVGGSHECSSSSSDGHRRGRPQTFCAREKRQLPPPPVERPRTRTGTPPPGKPLGRRHDGRGTTRCPGNSRKQRERRRAAPPDGMAQDCQRVCQNRQGPAKNLPTRPATGTAACGRSRAGRWPGTWPPGRTRRRRRRAGGSR